MALLQGDETRLRPDAATAGLLIGALQALQRLSTCPQLQEEICAVKCFASLFSLLDCSCDRVSMEAARLLTRLWAPAAARHGCKPFVNRSTGEEYHLNHPEDALTVRATPLIRTVSGAGTPDNSSAHQAGVDLLLQSGGASTRQRTRWRASICLQFRPFRGCGHAQVRKANLFPRMRR